MPPIVKPPTALEELGPRMPYASPNVDDEAGGASGVSADYVGSNRRPEPMDRRTSAIQAEEPGHEFYGGLQRWKMLVGR